MDKTEIKGNEWTGGGVICRETMMHSHDRCIKVVYARQEEDDQPLSRPSETAADYEGSKTV